MVRSIFCFKYIQINLLSKGLPSEKGTILGIFRSLQALARAIGPLSASFGRIHFSLK
jgi:hypothetical protein